MFEKFFSSAHMTATYKPVFVRALADIGMYGQDGLIGSQWIHSDGSRIRLDLDFIAIRLAKYYWDMEAVAHMRHIPKGVAKPDDPLRDIRIIELIRDYENTDRNSDDGRIIKRQPTDEVRDSRTRQIKPPTLKELESDGMKEFRKKVVGEAMLEVLDHLPKSMLGLYKWDKKKRQIEFDKDLVEFMRCFGYMIKRASCHLLARKLEQLNPSIRLAATITNSAEDIRKTLKEMSKMYTEMLPDPLYAAVRTKRRQAR